MTGLHDNRLQKTLWTPGLHEAWNKFINGEDSLSEYQNELKTAAGSAGGARTTTTTTTP